MADNKNMKAKLVYKLYEKYSETVTTILVINCVTSVLVSSITTYYFSNLLGDSYVGIVTIILTLIILIFTEIIPKIIGREYSEYFALKFSGLLKYLVLIFTPVSRAISKFERKIKNDHKVTATKDELVEIVKTIKDEGVIEEKESIFIQKAVILKKLKVQNVMIDKDNVSYLYDTAKSDKVKNSERNKNKKIILETLDLKGNDKLIVTSSSNREGLGLVLQKLEDVINANPVIELPVEDIDDVEEV